MQQLTLFAQSETWKPGQWLRVRVSPVPDAYQPLVCLVRRQADDRLLVANVRDRLVVTPADITARLSVEEVAAAAACDVQRVADVTAGLLGSSPYDAEA